MQRPRDSKLLQRIFERRPRRRLEKTDCNLNKQPVFDQLYEERHLV